MTTTKHQKLFQHNLRPERLSAIETRDERQEAGAKKDRKATGRRGKSACSTVRQFRLNCSPLPSFSMKIRTNLWAKFRFSLSVTRKQVAPKAPPITSHHSPREALRPPARKSVLPPLVSCPLSLVTRHASPRHRRIPTFTIHHSPFTIHRAKRSPAPQAPRLLSLASRLLPLVTRHASPRRRRIPTFTIHHSPFTIHHSPFTIHHSPFTIHHSPFTNK
ncbi:hypothetical protein Paes_1731 [Prosthecochloris aestuarii DSM 271]|uniref:Uncharacterized protein n=1 Tax=Prosthecochloris aestuarii (strain DSM 271 / SK 413) TaxID=290512 RepID=B4S3L0_PROA2|nr:hypothetical protein Paes_1731 [Prosthecochloris aestuarii DSM 271]